MGRLFILILFCIIWFGKAYSNVPDTIRIETKKNKRPVYFSDFIDFEEKGLSFWNDKFKGHWAGFYMGFNAFLNEDYSGYPINEYGFMNINTWKSLSYNVNFFSKCFSLQYDKNSIGIVTGFGLVLDDYRLGTDLTIEYGEDGKIHPVPLDLNTTKSKIRTSFIRVPVLFEFQVPASKPKNRFWISGGIIFGYQIWEYTKIKYKELDKNKSLKTRNDLQINDFRYSLSFRMGYKRIKIFSEYSLQPFFKNGTGPILHPFKTGIAIVAK
jgi:hypothetical protein